MAESRELVARRGPRYGTRITEVAARGGENVDRAVRAARVELTRRAASE